ncbi:hypothetical protein [Pantoea stewartii]|uniref:hypothetical protein n=1 Tax=Pantoea stewartii TaxID=66269 RepID=UPI0019812F3E|nr:hypothetical protein [Pantoea stewartii]
MSTLGSFAFSYSIRSRDAASQCKLSVSILSVMVAIYFFFLKKEVLLTIANGQELERALAWSNGLFACALFMALISVITGFFALDKQAFLNITETFKSFDDEMEASQIAKLNAEFEMKMKKSEKLSGVSLLLIVASIICAALAVFCLFYDYTETSVKYGLGAGLVLSIIFGALGYSKFAEPKRM